MAYNTIDGSPPMSLASGGTNEIPPQILAMLQQQAQQKAAQQSIPQQQMAQQAAAMPTGNSAAIQDAINQAQVIAARMKALKDSGVFDTDYQRQAKNHPILSALGTALMVGGQGLSGKPFVNEFYNNADQQQRQQIENMTNLAKMGASGLTPEQAIVNQYRMDSLEQRKENQSQTQWSSFINKVNPGTASSRSTLGMTANGSLRANRALATIVNNPVMTYQDLGNVVGDLAGIYQGGAPTDMGMKHQQYDSIQIKLANLKQFLTGKPQDAVPSAIKSKLVEVIKGLKDVNNKALKQNLDAMEGAQKSLIAKHPEEWQQFRKQIESEYMNSGNELQNSAYSDPDKEARYQAWKASQK